MRWAIAQRRQAAVPKQNTIHTPQPACSPASSMCLELRVPLHAIGVVAIPAAQSRPCTNQSEQHQRQQQQTTQAPVARRLPLLPAVIRPDARFSVAHIPGLWAQHPQEGSWVHGARPNLTQGTGWRQRRQQCSSAQALHGPFPPLPLQ